MLLGNDDWKDVRPKSSDPESVAHMTIFRYMVMGAAIVSLVATCAYGIYKYSKSPEKQVDPQSLNQPTDIKYHNRGK